MAGNEANVEGGAGPGSRSELPADLGFDQDWDEDPVFGVPPEAFADDLGLSPEAWREYRAEREAAWAEDEEVSAAWKAGTLIAEDEVPGLLEAAYAVEGELAGMTDAEVITVAVKTQEATSRLAARRYAAEAELMRRRPARYWDRSQQRDLERQDEQDGLKPDSTAPNLAGPVLAPTRELVQELMLALTWTQYRAEMDTTRAAALIRRMPVALAMLRDGSTDDEHIRTLEEALRDLSDENAGQVDAQLSPKMPGMTTQDVREAARRIVIRLDPDAAERRRKRNEKKARAVTWSNDDHTATFALDRIPAPDAAAMKARVNAIARAAKSAGSADPLPLLEAKTGVGLILGTLPYIPPSGGDNGDPRGPGYPGDPGDQPGGSDRGDNGQGGGQDDDGPRDERPEDQPEEQSDDRLEVPRPAESPEDGGGPGWKSWPRIPETSAAAGPGCADLPAAFRPAAPGRIRLHAPWRTLAGLAGEPGELSWFGVVTPGQVRELAEAAARDRSCRWQVIVTDDSGRLLDIADVRRPFTRRGSTPGLVSDVTLTITASYAAALAENPDLAATVLAALERLDPGVPSTDFGPVISLLTETVIAANQAAAEAGLRVTLDEAAGGCAHTMQVDSYTVGGRLRRWITARDRTCRNPMCRRRAAQCDVDHSQPYDQGGRSCTCGTGCLCRIHHQLKQLPGWTLRQDGGVFTWITPAGLEYRQEPHRYPV